MIKQAWGPELSNSLKSWRRVLSALVSVTGMGAVLLTAPSGPAAAAGASCAAEAGSLDQAVAIAKSCNGQVEVASSRTEVSQTFANPSGSMTTVMSTSPQRARRSDGSWGAVDTRLQRLSDGSLAPVNSTAKIRISGGGAGPLVTFPAGGGRLAYTWGSALPPAEIDGDSAVYAEVAPGIDLRVRALADGFTYSLIVKNADAVDAPLLKSFKLGLDAAGLTVRPKSSGGFDAVTGSGSVAIASGTGLMWDAAGVTGGQASARSEISAETVDAGYLAAQVPDGSATAEVATSATTSSLTISPNISMLSDPATVFPVVIDPVSKTISQTGWGYTNSTNSTRDDNVARVGQNPDGSGTYRSFFTFNSGAVIGRPATVLRAEFQTYMTHSWDCDPTPVNLWAVSAFSSGKNTWSGPSLGAWIGELSGNAHKPSQGGEGCGSDPQPDDYMEWTNDTLKNGVQYALDQGWSNYALGLLTRQQDGSSETTSTWWKKFDPSRTKLYVEWNKNPTTPVLTDMETAPTSTTAGTLCTTTGTLIRSASPVLRAKLRDPDNETGGALTGVFVTQEWDPATSTWRDPPLVGRPGASQATKYAYNVAPATPSAPSNYASVSLGELVQGYKYRWQVQAQDSLGAVSGWSAWCEFTVSSEPLPTVPGIASADGKYPAPDDTHTGVYGGVGQPGQFTFTSNGSAVSTYKYHLEGDAEYTVSADVVGGSATVWVTPSHPLDNVLYVRGVDAAGNSTPDAIYTFRVNVATGEVAVWRFDDGTGNTAAATGTGAKTATLATGTTWVGGRILGTGPTGTDRAVKFASNAYAETASAVLDTSKAYSVSAWVKLDSVPTSAATIVSQEGTTSSAFKLRYVPPTYYSSGKQSGGGWCLTNVKAADGSSTASICSITTPKVGVWTHLVAGFDPGAPNAPLSLYVDGSRKSCPLGNCPATVLWAATGKFSVGRAKSAGANAEFFPGQVAEVRAWQRVIYPDLDILPALAAIKVGAWNFQDANDNSIATGADVSGYNRTLTPSASSAEIVDDQVTWTGKNAVLSGTSGEFHTATPVLSTSTSFSVAVRVQITDPAAAGTQTILSQDGGSQSAFSLSYRSDNGGQWVWQVPDTATGSTATVVTAPATTPGDWHRLAAAYDATSKSLLLYVDGTMVSSATMNTAYAPWDGTGSFVIGRAMTTTGNVQWLTGVVDTVRAYAGALTAAEVSLLAQADNESL